MIGRATLKRAIKQTSGWAAVLSQSFVPQAFDPGACIFYYHRVAEVPFMDSDVDDWNVTPKQFERQIAKLVEFAEIVPLSDIQKSLEGRDPHAKPLVCITFDDGYANFHSEVLPILERYCVPVTAFVVTSSIGNLDPMPFDHWANKHRRRVQAESWRPLNWQELESCIASGLVTIGAHSHQHLRGSRCTSAQIGEEVQQSREILTRNLGKAHSAFYAYPYGNTKLGDVSTGYVNAVRNAGFEMAVTTDLGLVNNESDFYCLPRLEAHMMDSPGVIKAKATGALAPYRLIDHFRRSDRAA